jgi:hypothetical protein
MAQPLALRGASEDGPALTPQPATRVFGQRPVAEIATASRVRVWPDRAGGSMTSLIARSCLRWPECCRSPIGPRAGGQSTECSRAILAVFTLFALWEHRLQRQQTPENEMWGTGRGQVRRIDGSNPPGSAFQARTSSTARPHDVPTSHTVDTMEDGARRGWDPSGLRHWAHW